MDRIAIKRLSSSDLTFFRPHFEQSSGTKQKAWNLDKAIFIRKLYPSGFGEKTRMELNLVLFGPSDTPRVDLSRKIVLQQKNWRLNGELISENPENYSQLSANDYAILLFEGAPYPTRLIAHLVSATSDSDLHTSLTAAYQDKFDKRTSMAAATASEIISILNYANIDGSHPLRQTFENDDIEEYVAGGITGYEALTDPKRQRSISAEDLEKAKESAKINGYWGENLVDSYLLSQKEEGTITDYRWSSQENAISPFDFEIIDGEQKTLVDVKSTSSKFENRFHISTAELATACSTGSEYIIFRVSNVSEFSGELRISQDISKLACEILESLKELPPGVKVDSVSIPPENLSFSDPIRLDGE